MFTFVDFNDKVVRRKPWRLKSPPTRLSVKKVVRASNKINISDSRYCFFMGGIHCWHVVTLKKVISDWKRRHAMTSSEQRYVYVATHSLDHPNMISIGKLISYYGTIKCFIASAVSIYIRWGIYIITNIVVKCLKIFLTIHLSQGIMVLHTMYSPQIYTSTMTILYSKRIGKQFAGGGLWQRSYDLSRDESKLPGNQ